ncbi:hypothetical protein TRVL_08728 [Trypanosoma vivax]|nr:hypothetical protein TRVL_08728 [Trypanosoma vivax]
MSAPTRNDAAALKALGVASPAFSAPASHATETQQRTARLRARGSHVLGGWGCGPDKLKCEQWQERSLEAFHCTQLSCLSTASTESKRFLQETWQRLAHDGNNDTHEKVQNERSAYEVTTQVGGILCCRQR